MVGTTVYFEWNLCIILYYLVELYVQSGKCKLCLVELYPFVINNVA